MWWSKRAPIAVVVLGICAQSAGMLAQEGLSCPRTVHAAGSADAPAGWTAEALPAEYPFERISIFQRSERGEVFDLAPDRTARRGSTVTQTWNVPHDAAMATYLRCRYKGTSATLIKPLDVAVHACTFRFQAGEHGAVNGGAAVNCR